MVDSRNSRQWKAPTIRVSQAIGVIAIAVVAACAGCGREPSSQSDKPAGRAPNTPLPEWAPENPSPEFLRAARVLKPMAGQPGGADQGDLAAKAFSVRYKRTLVPAWEFFGTLSDQQIQHFLATRELRMQIRDLTPRQRAALYRYFDTWREQMKGLAERPLEWGEDWLVDLYKFGAKEDLSNVQIEFLVRGRSRVAMILRARQPDGSLSPPCPAGIGDL